MSEVLTEIEKEPIQKQVDEYLETVRETFASKRKTAEFYLETINSREQEFLKYFKENPEYCIGDFEDQDQHCFEITFPYNDCDCPEVWCPSVEQVIELIKENLEEEN